MTEVEVKLTVSKEGYNKLITSLAMNMTAVIRQMNIFFCTNDNKLERNMRLRKMETAEFGTKWVFTSKGAGSIINGISTHSEIEDVVSEEVAQNMLNDTENLYKYLPRCIQEVVYQTSKSKFRILCNFLSVRRVIPFNGMIIEADECTLPTHEQYYEIEVESDQPAETKLKIQAYLDSIGVEYKESKRSKFSRVRKLDPKNYINFDI